MMTGVIIIIALASDHVGYTLKVEIIELLEEMELKYKDFGTYDNQQCDYPVYSYKAATAVASGECDKGILFCGTGVGISIAANKVKGIRCVVCTEPYSAVLSKAHNDSNMLAMGARVIGVEMAKMIAKQWLLTDFEGGRHLKRVLLIQDIEEGKMKQNVFNINT